MQAGIFKADVMGSSFSTGTNTGRVEECWLFGFSSGRSNSLAQEWCREASAGIKPSSGWDAAGPAAAFEKSWQDPDPGASRLLCAFLSSKLTVFLLTWAVLGEPHQVTGAG